jgi:hypothetical protein
MAKKRKAAEPEEASVECFSAKCGSWFSVDRERTHVVRPSDGKEPFLAVHWIDEEDDVYAEEVPLQHLKDGRLRTESE